MRKVRGGMEWNRIKWSGVVGIWKNAARLKVCTSATKHQRAMRFYGGICFSSFCCLQRKGRWFINHVERTRKIRSRREYSSLRNGEVPFRLLSTCKKYNNAYKFMNRYIRDEILGKTRRRGAI